jgi:hypothetical protein
MAQGMKTRDGAGAAMRAYLTPRNPRPVDVARVAGVSRQYVHAVMSGASPPSQKVIEACAELGLPVEDIFGVSAQQRVL